MRIHTGCGALSIPISPDEFAPESCFRRSDYVASMSRGAAGNNLEALKTNGNFCDMTRHGIFENAS
jgi:hypothetical protein